MLKEAKLLTGKGKVWIAVLFAASIILAPMQPANAAYLYNWDSAQKFSDPVGDAINSPSNTGRDIVAAWGAVDGGHTYFRIDLVSAPVEDYNWGTKFGIYIDNKAGGAPASNYNVPQISGIDGKIDSTLYVWPNQWVGKYKYWDAAANDFSSSSTTGVAFQHTENGGATLEWRYEGDFGDFTWYAASLYEGYSDSVKCTFDYLATPIPSSILLLGSGLIALIGLGRRRAGKK